MDKFHKHLDECSRCNKNPFDLCKVGEVLLKEAAMETYSIIPRVNKER